MAKKFGTPDELSNLKAALDAAEFDFDNAKLAYYRRAHYKGQEVTYDVVTNYAQIYIARNYDYQKAAFGRIRIRLAVARLMRE